MQGKRWWLNEHTIATVALFIASTTNILVPKYGGKIIDIVSKDLRTEITEIAKTLYNQ